jgi:Tol biopolymer transport system component
VLLAALRVRDANGPEQGGRRDEPTIQEAAIPALRSGAGRCRARSRPDRGREFQGENGVIAFDSWTGTSQDIGVFDPSVGGSPTFLTTTSDFSEQTPRWSPDGTKIVYMGHPQFGEDDQRSVTDIWVMDADGQHKTQLTNTPRREEVPAWTADGRIVYCGQSGDSGGWDIYLMNADGSGLTRLTDSAAFDCWPSPAPHGDKLAFTRIENGVPKLLTMKLDGTGVREVTTGYTSDWSPAGNDLVFGRDAPDSAGVPDADTDVWMIHTDGSGLRRLTHTPGRIEFFPSWAPDGTTVVFGGLVKTGVINIFSLDPATGDEQLLLADSPPATYSVAAPAWQPLKPNEDQ